MAHLELPLPQDYVLFLLTNGNGGVCDQCECEIQELEESVDLFEMYKLDGENSVVDMTRHCSRMVKCPRGMLVFGADSYGNPFVFRNLDRDSNVWYWDYNRDFSEELEEPIEDQFYWVADSFTAFSEKVIRVSPKTH